MGIFSNILAKLGFGEHASESSAAAAPSSPASDSDAGSSAAAPAAAPAVAAISEVDVAAQLDALAQANPEKLNWKVSIVDLMKLLGLDSSLAQRKQLATELGCPSPMMEDSATMNLWLHKTVLQQLAANGGKVPPDLLI